MNSAFTLNSGHGYGNPVKTHDVAGLILRDCLYGPNLKTPNHAHEYAHFGIVLQGALTEVYAGTSRVYQPSALVFHPSGEIHQNVFHTTGGRMFIVELTPEWMERARTYSTALNYSFDSHGGVLGQLAIKLHNEFREMDGISPLAIEGLALEMIAQAMRSTQPAEHKPPRWLQQVKEILHAQFAEKPTIAGIAASVGVHPVHLMRTFNRHYHCTIGEYVCQLRVEYACQQISNPDLSLAEIALAAGFADQSHFARTFKRTIGVSPTAFRANLSAR
jgi:AraC family transcriptional regulator